jgi:medium-chain acyl-[acyl-carrier-protein] hydrolase
MEPIFVQEFEITDLHVDCRGRLLPSKILYLMQEVAGTHFAQLSMDYDALARRGLFWAITRNKVQITRLPMRGEKIRLETWPMPTTRVAYPRSIVAYDEAGNEVFRSITLWVLMDIGSRSMILPGKSGISVEGTLRGNELASPLGLPAKTLEHHSSRCVRFTDLDRNSHMNNTKYMDWIWDLLPSGFHAEHNLREFTVCYLSEARENQELKLSWGFMEDGTLHVDANRQNEDKDERIFAAKILFD